MGNSPWPLPPWLPMRSLGEPWKAGFQGGESPWQVRAGGEWRWGELGHGVQDSRRRKNLFNYSLDNYNMPGIL